MSVLESLFSFVAWLTAGLRHEGSRPIETVDVGKGLVSAFVVADVTPSWLGRDDAWPFRPLPHVGPASTSGPVPFLYRGEYFVAWNLADELEPANARQRAEEAGDVAALDALDYPEPPLYDAAVEVWEWPFDEDYTATEDEPPTWEDSLMVPDAQTPAEWFERAWPHIRDANGRMEEPEMPEPTITVYGQSAHDILTLDAAAWAARESENIACEWCLGEVLDLPPLRAALHRAWERAEYVGDMVQGTDIVDHRERITLDDEEPEQSAGYFMAGGINHCGWDDDYDGSPDSWDGFADDDNEETLAAWVDMSNRDTFTARVWHQD